MPSTPSSRPTLEDVAARAGVSRGTASRALAGNGPVAAVTRRLVEAAAAELGYHANAAARSLVTRRTGTVALVIGENDQRLFTEPFFATLVHAVGSRLAARGVLTVLVADWPDARTGLRTDFLRAGHVDGIVLASAHRSTALVDQVLSARVPVVLVGQLAEAPGLSWVDADNVGGVRAATEHLLSRGCRRIATITGPEDLQVSSSRHAGWEQALATAGRADIVGPAVAGDFTLESGRRAAEELLRRDPTVDGVVAASDLMALGACQALRAAGRRVGADVRVVGFDDSPAAAHADPPLSSVRQPVAEMGARAADLVLDEVDGAGGAGRQVLLPTTLVVRESG